MILLGAAGAYNWIGTIVHQTAQKSDILPKAAFEKILDDRNHSSLLGKQCSSSIGRFVAFNGLKYHNFYINSGMFFPKVSILD